MNSINIKDLAKLLSLNPSTVSRALSDHPDIKSETKERVKAAAAEFNYLPNLHARYFRQKSSRLIALVLPEFNMYFIPGLMDGVNTVLKDSGYSIIIFFSDNSLEREKEIVNYCLSWVVEGVLISLSEHTKNCDHLLPLKDAGITVVLLDKVIHSQDFTTVTIDDKDAARNAVQYLYENKKTHILGIFANPSLEITRLRVAGFTSAHLDAGLPPPGDEDIVYIYKDTKSEWLEAKLLAKNYDGVFVMSDELLMYSYASFRKLQLYPQKISIVAISDGILPIQLYPQVSHFLHSGYEIGKKAAAVLLSTKKEPSGVFHHVIPIQLIRLDSVV